MASMFQDKFSGFEMCSKLGGMGVCINGGLYIHLMDVVLDGSPVSQVENLSSISTGSYLPCSLLYPKAIIKGLHKAKIKYKYINEGNQLISE